MIFLLRKTVYRTSNQNTGRTLIPFLQVSGTISKRRRTAKNMVTSLIDKDHPARDENLIRDWPFHLQANTPMASWSLTTLCLKTVFSSFYAQHFLSGYLCHQGKIRFIVSILMLQSLKPWSFSCWLRLAQVRFGVLHGPRLISKISDGRCPVHERQQEWRSKEISSPTMPTCSTCIDEHPEGYRPPSRESLWVPAMTSISQLFLVKGQCAAYLHYYAQEN